MINNHKIVVILPAFNAEKTLEKTLKDIPSSIVDDIVLVDDASKDNTVKLAESLGIKHIVRHAVNRGYGGNQKSCYDKALDLGADIVIMLHPDYQYTPLLITSMASLIASGIYKVVIASRILGKGALKGGMPLYKYFFNRMLTFLQNIIIGQKLSEYHSGYRAFSGEVLRKINYHANSDDFIFDNQMIAQVFYAGYEIAEITCPTKYFEEASSINFRRSLIYGLGVLKTSVSYLLQKKKLAKFRIFEMKF